MKQNGRDWFKFFVHFVCGSVLGAVLGVGLWSRPEFGLSESSSAGILCILFGAVLVGLAAAYAGDEFWEYFRK